MVWYRSEMYTVGSNHVAKIELTVSKLTGTGLFAVLQKYFNSLYGFNLVVMLLLLTKPVGGGVKSGGKVTLYYIQPMFVFIRTKKYEIYLVFLW